MRHLRLLLLALTLSLPAAAWAQRSAVVVELFTSQGCSSCPPADAILAEIAARPDVIALALHVDYWDYLGWTDPFGKAAHTARQRGYAKKVRQRSVYTPQMIVQGVDRVVGADHDAVAAFVSAHQARPAPVALRAQRHGRALRIRLAPLIPVAVGPSDVYVVRYLPGGTMLIEHGENAGWTADFVNVVTDWSAVAQWDGAAEAELAVELPDAGPVAVIVQRERLGPILAAAKLP